MPTGVRILLPSSNHALVTQPGLECFPPKEEVASSNLAESVLLNDYIELDKFLKRSSILGSYECG